ncbi:MAG: hypothetical protein LLG37_04915 [Spirochaetia bacterium]|nr:hypothetical protein [Spirochaetia bacterium]
MRTTRFILSIIMITVFSIPLFSAEAKGGKAKSAAENREPGSGPVTLGGREGPGTEADFFDDESLVSTPEPTATPNYSFKTPEKEAWVALTDAKALINRCNKDLPRCTKVMKEDFMKQYNAMGGVVASIHTQALLDRRDQVEYAWEESVEKTRHTLALGEEWTNEFFEDYNEAVKKQERVTQLLKKFRSKILQPDEVEQKQSHNKEELFFLKKDIEKFRELYNANADRFNGMLLKKEEKVNQLLNEHYELYRP